MSRFFLHQEIDGDILEDPDGTEAADLAEVRQQAIEAARQLVANAILGGTAPLGRAFRITDEAGHVLLVLPFRDALPPDLFNPG